jgi:hypothetical protein
MMRPVMSKRMKISTPSSTRANVHPDRWGAFVLALITIVFFLPVLFQGNRALLGTSNGDMQNTFYPYRDFAGTEWLSGRLPLWNPFLFMGQPTMGEGQTAAFYPPNLIATPLPVVIGIHCFLLLHLIAAAGFAYAYLRRLGQPATSSVFGTIVYVFGSGTVARLYSGHYSMVPYWALGPALLWVWESYRKERKSGYLLGAIGVYGCMILAGHPQTLFYLSLYLAFLWICHLAENIRDRRTLEGIRTVGWFALALGVGVLLGSAQLLPTLDFVRDSFRRETTYAFCGEFSLPPENLLTAIAPGFFGDSLQFPYWGRFNLWESWFYMGIVPLGFVIAALSRPRLRSVWPHALAVCIFGTLALGKFTPLHPFLWKWVPGFDLFRGPGKFLIGVQIATCVLAAEGFRRCVCAENRRERLAFLYSMLAIIGLCVLAMGFFGPGASENGSLWMRFVKWRYAQGDTYTAQFNIDSLPSARDTWDVASTWLIRAIVFSSLGLIWSVLVMKRTLRGKFALVAAILIASIDLFLFASSYLVVEPVEQVRLPSRIAERAREAGGRTLAPDFEANVPSLDRIGTVRGYMGLILQRTNDFFCTIWGYPLDAPMSASPIPNRLSPATFWPNVRTIVLPDKKSLPTDAFEEIERSRGFALYRVIHDFPRAYFAQNVIVVKGRAEAIDALRRTVGNNATHLGETDVVETNGDPAIPGIEGVAPGDTVSIATDLPCRVEMNVAASGTRWLVLTDTFDRWWTCRTGDGESLRVYPANVAFRGVVVPQGVHRIVFEYRPMPFYIGLGISLTTLAALIVFAIRSNRKKRGENETA